MSKRAHSPSRADGTPTAKRAKRDLVKIKTLQRRTQAQLEDDNANIRAWTALVEKAKQTNTTRTAILAAAERLASVVSWVDAHGPRYLVTAEEWDNTRAVLAGCGVDTSDYLAEHRCTVVLQCHATLHCMDDSRPLDPENPHVAAILDGWDKQATPFTPVRASWDEHDKRDTLDDFMCDAIYSKEYTTTCVCDPGAECACGRVCSAAHGKCECECEECTPGGNMERYGDYEHECMSDCKSDCSVPSARYGDRCVCEQTVRGTFTKRVPTYAVFPV